MITAGIAPLQGLEHAVMAAGACVRYGAMVKASHGRDITLPPVIEPPHDASMLDEYDSKHRLAAYGVAIPEGRIVDRAHARQAAEEIGYPVVLKALDSAIIHKSDLGALRARVSAIESIPKIARKLRKQRFR